MAGDRPYGLSGEVPQRWAAGEALRGRSSLWIDPFPGGLISATWLLSLFLSISVVGKRTVTVKKSKLGSKGLIKRAPVKSCAMKKLKAKHLRTKEQKQREFEERANAQKRVPTAKPMATPPTFKPRDDQHKGGPARFGSLRSLGKKPTEAKPKAANGKSPEERPLRVPLSKAKQAAMPQGAISIEDLKQRLKERNEARERELEREAGDERGAGADGRVPIVPGRPVGDEGLDRGDERLVDDSGAVDGHGGSPGGRRG